MSARKGLVPHLRRFSRRNSQSPAAAERLLDDTVDLLTVIESAQFIAEKLMVHVDDIVTEPAGVDREVSWMEAKTEAAALADKLDALTFIFRGEIP